MSDDVTQLPPRAVRRLARRASRARRRGPQRTVRLAQKAGVTPRQLRLLADAWDAGGAAGVDALGPAPADLAPDVADAAAATLDDWRRRHYPLEALEWEVWRNRITIWLLTPDPTRRGDPQRRPLLQLRWTAGGRWHLYRRAAQGEWWPVRIRERREPCDLQRCLDVARVDGGNVFWRAAGNEP